MMTIISPYQDYRIEASRRFAERAVTADLRSQWNNLARDWLNMIPPDHRLPEDTTAPDLSVVT